MEGFVDLKLDVCISEEHYNRLVDLYKKSVIIDRGMILEISDEKFIESYLSVILENYIKKYF